MKKKVLNCPFCGNFPYVIEDTTYGDCQVLCNCDAEPCISMDKGEILEAIMMWNKRAKAMTYLNYEISDY